MRQVFRINHEGYYLEPVLLMRGEETPSDCVEEAPPSFYKAKWQDGKWVEAGQAPSTEPAPLTTEQRIAALEKENKMYKLKLDAQADQYQFLEDVVTEIILMTQ